MRTEVVMVEGMVMIEGVVMTEGVVFTEITIREMRTVTTPEKTKLHSATLTQP